MAVKGVILRGGREVCDKTAAGRREYRRRTLQMYERDAGICCLCLRWMPEEQASFEHLAGRGMGGGKRRDDIESNAVSHFRGNVLRGSMSYERYMQKPLAERIRNCG